MLHCAWSGFHVSVFPEPLTWLHSSFSRVPKMSLLLSLGTLYLVGLAWENLHNVSVSKLPMAFWGAQTGAGVCLLIVLCPCLSGPELPESHGCPGPGFWSSDRPEQKEGYSGIGKVGTSSHPYLIQQEGRGTSSYEIPSSTKARVRIAV